MEDNNNQLPNNNSSKGDNMGPSKELYERLISEVYKYKLEEREMALDRYRRADSQMDSAETFILMGKNAIDFLKQAASASDGIEKLAKEIKSIVYKDDAGTNVDVTFNDAMKRQMIDMVKSEEENSVPDENLEDNKPEDNTEESED